MKYNHQKLLWEMLRKGVSQLKVISYFKGEGYTEDEIIREINDYEQQQSASTAMKELPEAPTIRNPPAQISKKAETLPAKILMIFLILLLIVLLTITMALVLR